MSYPHAPTPSTERRRTASLSAWIALLALIGGLALAPPWARFDDVPAGFAARLVAGDLERATDEGWVRVREGELVPEGADVRSTGGAMLTLGEGALSLGPEARVTLAETYTVAAGSILVDSPDQDRRAQVGAVQAEGRGIWRVDASPGERLAVYRGGLGVGSGDVSSIAAAALDEVDLIAGRLPQRALPLSYTTQDPWDLRLMAPAISADRQIAQLERSLAAEYGSEPREPAFYAAFGPDVLVDTLVELGGLDTAAPEGIVLVAITRLVAEERAIPAAEATQRTVSLRRDGATWGLILQRHDLDAGDLLTAAEEALDQAEETPPPGPAIDDGEGTGDDTPQAPPTPTAPPTPGPEPTPTPSPSPTPDPSPDPVDDVVDTVEDTVDDLVDLLPVDPPPPTVDDTVDDVTGLLRDEEG